MLGRHRVETEQQIQRLDEIMGAFGTSTSGLKAVALPIFASMAELALQNIPMVMENYVTLRAAGGSASH